MSVALREIMSDPMFQENLKQLAGASGLENQIAQISVIDTPLVPLPLYSLEDDVFVLSSLYLYQNDPEKMLEAVKNLQIMGVSALCIKTDLYVHSIPESIVTFCDQHGLPLFITAVPGISFRKIISTVQEHIKAADQAQRSSAIFDGYLRGNTKSMFAKLVSDSFPFNFVCLTCDRKVIAKSATFSRPTLNELEGAAQACLDNIDAISNTENPVTWGEYYCSPCYVRGNLEAVLVFRPAEGEYSYEVRKAEKTLTMLLSLQLMESILTESGYQQATAALASDILESEYPNEDRARQVFYSHGYPNCPYYRVLLCTGITVKGHSNTHSYFAEKGRQAIVTNTLSSLFPNSMCFVIEGNIVGVIPIREGSRYLNECAFVNVVRTMLDKLEKVSNLEISYSELQSRLMDSPSVLRHLFAFRKTHGNTREDRIYPVRDIDPVALAIAALESGRQDKVFDRIIHPIQEYDQRYNYSLIDTLLLCTETESLEKAAAALHIHTSTLRYRLQKIEQITGYSFFNSQDRVVLYISCLVWRMKEST